MAALALFALAQGVWLAAEFADQRGRAAERHALLARNPVPDSLRQEAENAVRYLTFARSQAEVVLKERIRDRVDEAVSIAASIYRQGDGKVAPAVLRTMVREGLRAPRFFDGRGYYFIDDFDGNCVLLPTAPEYEGTSLADNRDDNGRYIMRELIRAAQQPGDAGYVRYRWYAPGSTTQMAEKIAYVRSFPQLGWLIGSGDYIAMVEEDLKAEAVKRLRAITFPRDGGLVVIDGDGVVRLFRDSAGVEGKALANIADGPERRALEAIRAAAAEGRGAARFDWSSAATGRTERRIAWVAPSGIWGWTVAAVAAPPEGIETVEADSPLTLLWRFGVPALALLLALGGCAAVALPRGTDPDADPDADGGNGA